MHPDAFIFIVIFYRYSIRFYEVILHCEKANFEILSFIHCDNVRKEFKFKKEEEIRIEERMQDDMQEGGKKNYI